jgi:A/G-specific adenine glycosylase
MDTELVNLWYSEHARDLPWRRSGTSAWAILVSEVMLQQTPVTRVVPAYLAWLDRWPTPADLVADAPGEAVRMWGRLGYPRRALRLHECAGAIVERYGASVPVELPDLLSLPGVGAYTARAVASFAHRRRHAVVDTNVRRTVARAVLGVAALPPGSAAKDLALVEPLVPADAEKAAQFAAALMELGAVLCTARSPRCTDCPVISGCAWRAAGCPAADGPVRRPQRFAGTDRQVRGLLMEVLRTTGDPVTRAALDTVWDEPVRRDRALLGLLADGLVEELSDGRFTLPGAPSRR